MKIIAIAMFANLAIISIIVTIGSFYLESESVYFFGLPLSILLISIISVHLLKKSDRTVKSCCSAKEKLLSDEIPDGYIIDRQEFDTVIITNGCMVCNSCESLFPRAFKVFEDHTVVLGLIRDDGKSSDNLIELSKIKEMELSNRDLFREVADGCCVEVIKLIRKNKPKTNEIESL